MRLLRTHCGIYFTFICFGFILTEVRIALSSNGSAASAASNASAASAPSVVNVLSTMWSNSSRRRETLEDYILRPFPMMQISNTTDNLTITRRQVPSRLNPNWDHINYDPEVPSIKYKIIDISQNLIYFINKRLMDMQPILKKYSNRTFYRISFIYCHLDKLMLDLNRITTIMEWTAKPYYYVHEQIHVYEHALRKNVEITYVVDFLIDTHTRIVEDKTEGKGVQLNARRAGRRKKGRRSNRKRRQQ